MQCWKFQQGVTELINKAWQYASASIFLVIYRVLSWHEWKRAGALYGNFTHDTVLASLFPICVLVQQTNWGTYSTNVLSLVYVKLLWRDFWPVTPVHCYPLKMADFYCACVVPCLIHKLYSLLSLVPHTNSINTFTSVLHMCQTPIISLCILTMV